RPSRRRRTPQWPALLPRLLRCRDRRAPGVGLEEDDPAGDGALRDVRRRHRRRPLGPQVRVRLLLDQLRPSRPLGDLGQAARPPEPYRLDRTPGLHLEHRLRRRLVAAAGCGAYPVDRPARLKSSVVLMSTPVGSSLLLPISAKSARPIAAVVSTAIGFALRWPWDAHLAGGGVKSGRELVDWWGSRNARCPCFAPPPGVGAITRGCCVEGT